MPNFLHFDFSQVFLRLLLKKDCWDLTVGFQVNSKRKPQVEGRCILVFIMKKITFPQHAFYRQHWKRRDSSHHQGKLFRNNLRNRDLENINAIEYLKDIFLLLSYCAHFLAIPQLSGILLSHFKAFKHGTHCHFKVSEICSFSTLRLT